MRKGYSEEAQKIFEGAYSHIDGEEYSRGQSWRYNLTQEEVNLLHEKGRIGTEEPPEAGEFNDREKRKKLSNGLSGMDSLDVATIVEHRTEGERMCLRCGGSARVWASENIKEKHEEWEEVEPPEGEGWQVWETVSEGSPITPVFNNPAMLIQHLIEEEDWSKEAAENFVLDDEWAPSAIIDENGVQKGHEAIANER